MLGFHFAISFDTLSLSGGYVAEFIIPGTRDNEPSIAIHH
jgi:hypothetical protein